MFFYCNILVTYTWLGISAHIIATIWYGWCSVCGSLLLGQVRAKTLSSLAEVSG